MRRVVLVLLVGLAVLAFVGLSSTHREANASRTAPATTSYSGIAVE